MLVRKRATKIFFSFLSLILVLTISLMPAFEARSSAALSAAVTGIVVTGVISAMLGISYSVAEDGLQTAIEDPSVWETVVDFVGFYEGKIVSIRESTNFWWACRFSDLRDFCNNLKSKFGTSNRKINVDMSDRKMGIRNISTRAGFDYKTLDTIHSMELAESEGITYNSYYPTQYFVFGDYCYCYELSSSSNVAQYAYITPADDRTNILCRCPITPDYQGQNFWQYILEPIYVEDEDRVYLGLYTHYGKVWNYYQWSFASFSLAEIGEGVTQEDLQADSPPVTVAVDVNPDKDKLSRQFERRLMFPGKVLDENGELSYVGVNAEPIPMEDDDIVVSSFPLDIDVDNINWGNVYGRVQDLVDSDVITDNFVVVKPNVDTDTPVEAIEAVQALDIDMPDRPPGNPNKLSIPRLILTKFPFCLPGDIYKLVQGLNSPAEVFRFNIPVNFPAINYTYDFDIDLTDFSGVAAILRWCVVVLFCLGLIALTKSMFF